jgi:N-acetyl-gamma-glutamyl-phosphate reductase
MAIRASIIGASGYTGIELLRLLTAHPNVKLNYLISEHNFDKSIASVYPHLRHFSNHSFSKIAVEKIAAESDIVFLALPHTQSIQWVQGLLNYDCKIIDLSADFRLKDGRVYTEWYQHPAAAEALLKQAVYGLAEIGKRAEIADGRLIANPGCYPTAAILGLAPLMLNKALQFNRPLIIDAKSGVAGAGRNPNANTHFCEAGNNFSAYQLAGVHRHIPEIEQELTALSQSKIQIQFTPHLLPIARGLMATMYCPLSVDCSWSQVEEYYQTYYAQAHFVNVTNNAARPGLKSVIGSNFCHLSLHFDERNHYLVVVSCIDNLLKGASGQAVQNMNLMYQLPEVTGLEYIPMYP